MSEQTSGSSKQTEALALLRDKIDQIDIELQTLINRRIEIGKEIADIKRQSGDLPKFLVPEREAKILRDVARRNVGAPLETERMIRIFAELISLTRAAESDIGVALLGPEGTYTQEAAIKHFGHAIEISYQSTILEVFRAVEAGRAEFGVVPVENSSEGIVASTLDCISESSSQICGEIDLKIHHSLLSCGDDLESIETIVAHPQSIGQCRRWIAKNAPHAETKTATSNAEAARRIIGDPKAAAIASAAAAEIYDLKVLRANIEDQSGNTTRFLIIGNIETKSTGGDKTSILISRQNRPGSLLELLKPFAEHGISMTKIESRPSRASLWDYVFFIDFEGHTEDDNVVALLQELRSIATLFKLLGSYPKFSH